MLEGKKLFTNLLFLFTSISLCLPLFAQSGRNVPSRSPEPTSEALVIPESKKEYPPCEAGLGEIVLLHTLELTKLADELNKFGNCGYRVEGIFRKHSLPEDRAIQSKFSLYFKRDTLVNMSMRGFSPIALAKLKPLLINWPKPDFISEKQ